MTTTSGTCPACGGPAEWHRPDGIECVIEQRDRLRAALSREREARERAEAALRDARTLAWEWQSCDAIEDEDGEVTRGLAVEKTLRHCADGVLHIARAVLAGPSGEGGGKR